MNRADKLREICSSAFAASSCNPEHDYCDNYDYVSILKALSNRKEIVYRYRTDNNNDRLCRYRSEPLFSIPAMLLWSKKEIVEESVVEFGYYKELWLLTDLSFAAVSMVRIHDVTGSFTSEYRTIRTTELDDVFDSLEVSISDFEEAISDLVWDADYGFPLYEEVFTELPYECE